MSKTTSPLVAVVIALIRVEIAGVSTIRLEKYRSILLYTLRVILRRSSYPVVYYLRIRIYRRLTAL